MKPSLQWEWNALDTRAWLLNALWFLTPSLLVLIPSIIDIVPADWKYAVVVLYVLNRIMDALRRWYNGK